MQLRVYEINTDVYFRKNLSEFKSDIDLDGLVPQYEKNYDYSKLRPNFRHTEVIKLSSDPNARTQRCLCVIEFIGNGLSSRVIVQKGKLTLIQK